MMQLVLIGSVGEGGDNKPPDVSTVQVRLKELGYAFVGPSDGIIGPKTIHAIRLFQSVKDGSQTLAGDGRIDNAGDTHKWLAADNAPRWQRMPLAGEGFINIESQDTADLHDFGTNWLSDAIVATAQKFKIDYLEAHESSLMTINDASLPEGGDTSDHAGHETGLAIDVRLPQRSVAGAAAGGRTTSSSDFDRDATRALLNAFRSQPLANRSRVFLNDEILIDEGLCAHAPGHHDHIHLEVVPPSRQQ
jgi:peptidoglycan hydrolase-like protein with peptidoglycan-binding domain